MTNQPIEYDAKGVIRFRSNRIVEFLLSDGGLTLNDLAVRDFTQRDREQFAQLIGYSVCGYHELSYVSDESALAASADARRALNLPADQSVGCRDSGCEIHCGVETE